MEVDGHSVSFQRKAPRLWLKTLLLLYVCLVLSMWGVVIWVQYHILLEFLKSPNLLLAVCLIFSEAAQFVPCVHVLYAWSRCLSHKASIQLTNGQLSLSVKRWGIRFTRILQPEDYVFIDYARTVKRHYMIGVILSSNRALGFFRSLFSRYLLLEPTIMRDRKAASKAACHIASSIKQLFPGLKVINFGEERKSSRLLRFSKGRSD